MQNLLAFQCLHSRILQSLSFYSSQRETYYDILKLPHDCNAKQIRAAFVSLSKQFHPDVKGAMPDPKLTSQFVKISEAYQILSKPRSRIAYDQDLLYRGVKIATAASRANAHTATSGGGGGFTQVHRPWEVHPNYDANPGHYYGIKGLDRIPNSKIAWALIAIGIFSAVIGFASVKHTFTFSRNQLDEKSVAAGLHHANVRADAEKFGNEEQLRRMLGRMIKTTDK